MDFRTLAAERYSVRQFKPQPVERATIEEILRIGHLAPTGCNNQPQRILVMTSDEAMTKLRRCTKCHFGAPMAMLICYDRTECWQRRYDGKLSGEDDASIVTTHLMLAAADLGVGTTWVMHFIPEAVREEFALPADLEPVALLVMGYPADDAQPAPLHAQQRPMDEVVSWI